MSHPTYVKIRPGRGYGSQPFRVLSEDARHYNLEGVGRIYKTHCFEDLETRKMRSGAIPLSTALGLPPGSFHKHLQDTRKREQDEEKEIRNAVRRAVAKRKGRKF